MADDPKGGRSEPPESGQTSIEIRRAEARKLAQLTRQELNAEGAMQTALHLRGKVMSEVETELPGLPSAEGRTRAGQLEDIHPKPARRRSASRPSPEQAASAAVVEDPAFSRGVLAPTVYELLGGIIDLLHDAAADGWLDSTKGRAKYLRLWRGKIAAAQNAFQALDLTEESQRLDELIPADLTPEALRDIEVYFKGLTAPSTGSTGVRSDHES